jgi:hypothetical protein
MGQRQGAQARRPPRRERGVQGATAARDVEAPARQAEVNVLPRVTPVGAPGNRVTPMPERDRNLAQNRHAVLIARRRRLVAEREAALERRRQAAVAKAAEPRPEPLQIKGDDELSLRDWLAKGGRNDT